MDPRTKRLAVETDDHPLDFANFEGVIPEGNYGAGPIIIWDLGDFCLLGNESASVLLTRGHLELYLDGSKIRGRFGLARMDRSKNAKDWLLIKRKDEYADETWNPETFPRSVKSGKTLEELS